MVVITIEINLRFLQKLKILLTEFGKTLAKLLPHAARIVLFQAINYFLAMTGFAGGANRANVQDWVRKPADVKLHSAFSSL